MVLKPHSQFKIVSILYIKSKALDLRAMTELLLLLSFRGVNGVKISPRNSQACKSDRAVRERCCSRSGSESFTTE